MPAIDAIREMYNASGVHPTTDPDDPGSHCVVDRYHKHLCKLISPGMRALDLGCNAGRLTFAMEGMGAIATGIDFAEIPILHAKKIAHKRKSQCQFSIGDIAALPYKEDAFDLALLPQNIGYLSYQSVEYLSVQLKEILSDNGVFVVIMQDELVKRAGEENLPDRYNVQTGLRQTDTGSVQSNQPNEGDSEFKSCTSSPCAGSTSSPRTGSGKSGKKKLMSRSPELFDTLSKLPVDIHRTGELVRIDPQASCCFYWNSFNST